RGQARRSICCGHPRCAPAAWALLIQPLAKRLVGYGSSRSRRSTHGRSGSSFFPFKRSPAERAVRGRRGGGGPRERPLKQGGCQHWWRSRKLLLGIDLRLLAANRQAAGG